MKDSHKYSDMRACNIDVLAEVSLHIQGYLDELSRVLSIKESPEKQCEGEKREWWFSVFFSLCIQSLVKKALMKLSNWGGNKRTYLRLPVRGFEQLAGDYDPLVEGRLGDLKKDEGWEWEGASDEDEMPVDQDMRTAHSIVDQQIWNHSGVQSSQQYLRFILEDEDDISPFSPRDDYEFSPDEYEKPACTIEISEDEKVGVLSSNGYDDDDDDIGFVFSYGDDSKGKVAFKKSLHEKKSFAVYLAEEIYGGIDVD
jgi:hypothetical protein